MNAKIVKFIKKAGRDVAADIFPAKCVVCGRKLNSYDYGFCEECKKELKPLDKHETSRVNFCDRCIAVYEYDGHVKDTILALKFYSHPAYAGAFTDALCDMLSKYIDISYDAVTWIPISKKRLRKRGYDQAELIAAKLAEKLNLPLLRTLVKVRDNRQQSTLDAAARKGNVIGVYNLYNKNTSDIKGLNILLMDDIITTGSTMSEAAKILKTAEPANVTGICCAKTVVHGK